ncbi:MAG: hypothetical protein ACFE7R_04985, partial [Candidatus Hodarchaeota archaeon]
MVDDGFPDLERVTIDRPFVGRSEYLEELDKMIRGLKGKTRIVHLRGIGGVGKTALLRHIKKKHFPAIGVDCEDYSDLLARIERLATEAANAGAEVPRFDLLWNMRKEYLRLATVRRSARPFTKVLEKTSFLKIGELLSVGTMIGLPAAVWRAMKDRYDKSVWSIGGDWARRIIGSEFKLKWLELLMNDPLQARMFLLLALVTDLDTWADKEGVPLILIFDQYEEVDDSIPTAYLDDASKSKTVTEAEMWLRFLSKIRNSVILIASRTSLRKRMAQELQVIDWPLSEFSDSECHELLSLLGVDSESFRSIITKVSQQSPFVLLLIRDIWATHGIDENDLEGLEAEKLGDVREKTWNMLFGIESSSTKYFGLIIRASLLGFFNQRILRLVYEPALEVPWHDVVQFSFVIPTEHGFWKLHELAKQLMHAHLGSELSSVAEKVTDSLMTEYVSSEDVFLLALGLSVMSLASEEDASAESFNIISELLDQWKFEEALHVISLVQANCSSDITRGTLELLKGRAFTETFRISEAEEAYKRAESILEPIKTKDGKMVYSFVLDYYATLLNGTNRECEACDLLEKGLGLSRELAKDEDPDSLFNLSTTLEKFGMLRHRTGDLRNAVIAFDEAINLRIKVVREIPDTVLPSLANAYYNLGLVLLSIPSYDRVKECFEFSLNTWNKIKETQLFPKEWTHPPIAEVLKAKAKLMVQLNELDIAEQSLYEALKLLEEIEEDEYGVLLNSKSGVIANLAHLYYILGLPERCSDMYEKCLTIDRNLAEMHPGFFAEQLADVLLNFSQAKLLFGDLDTADSMLKESINLYKEFAKIDSLRFAKVLAKALALAGDLKLRRGQDNQAEKLHRDAISTAKRMRELTGIPCASILTDSLIKLGNILINSDRKAEAYQTFEEAIQLNEQLVESNRQNYLGSCGLALVRIAESFAKADDFEKSRVAFEKAILILAEVAEAAKDYTLRLAGAKCCLAVLLMKHGLKEQGIELLRSAAAHQKEIEKATRTSYIGNPIPEALTLCLEKI